MKENLRDQEEIFPADFFNRLKSQMHFTFIDSNYVLIFETRVMVCAKSLFEEWKAVSLPDENNFMIEILDPYIILNTRTNQFSFPDSQIKCQQISKNVEMN